MGLPKPFLAAALGIVFLFQATAIFYAGIMSARSSDGEIMSARSSDVKIMSARSYNASILRRNQWDSWLAGASNMSIRRNQSDGLPAGSSDVGHVRRQDMSDEWKYFGHRCRKEGTTDPVPPPGRRTCEAWPPLGKHHDAREQKLIDLANHFCINYFDSRNGSQVQDPINMPISVTLWRTTQSKMTWPQDDVYRYSKALKPHNNVWSFSVDWLFGCPTEDDDRISVPECNEHLWSAWAGCTSNRGRGGTLELGCWKWTATPVF